MICVKWREINFFDVVFHQSTVIGKRNFFGPPNPSCTPTMLTHMNQNSKRDDSTSTTTTITAKYTQQREPVTQHITHSNHIFIIIMLCIFFGHWAFLPFGSALFLFIASAIKTQSFNSIQMLT